MKIIRPDDVEPTVNPNAMEHKDGSQVHRRILSYPDGGPSTIDVGYNQSSRELDIAIPYAYNKHEYCYNIRGSVRAVNDGETVEAGTGMFMWRPAGAATYRVSTADNYSSICAFGPARTDGWSHRLPPEEVGKWDGDPAGKPQPQFRSLEDVASSPFAGARASGTIIHRKMFDTPHMEVSHTIMEESASLEIAAHDREDVYWLESGAASVTSGDINLMMNAGEFLHVRPGESIEALAVRGRSVLLRWSAPAAA
ncbi:hypothetical protein [Sphingobium sp.]|uniref:hypothetical protein n=1 Tax=Sphingobium sp. TaxID=1912891 RepID=UPI0028BF21F1|nr:hypothetical protein [Sphingobium sp.]